MCTGNERGHAGQLAPRALSEVERLRESERARERARVSEVRPARCAQRFNCSSPREHACDTHNSLPPFLGPCLSSFATFVSRSPTTSLRPFSPLSPRGARGSPHGAPRTPQEIQPRDPPRGSLAALAADVYLQLPVGSSPAASAKKTKIWKISAIVLVPRKATVKWTLAASLMATVKRDLIESKRDLHRDLFQV